jgi:hypothetical protein
MWRRWREMGFWKRGADSMRCVGRLFGRIAAAGFTWQLEAGAHTDGARIRLHSRDVMPCRIITTLAITCLLMLAGCTIQNYPPDPSIDITCPGEHCVRVEYQFQSYEVDLWILVQEFNWGIITQSSRIPEVIIENFRQNDGRVPHPLAVGLD